MPADQVRRVSFTAGGGPLVAVVMQGPLVAQDGFTAGTVELYRRQLRRAKVIVSTWQGSDAALVARLTAAGAEVVLSSPPDVSGVSNVNYQILSTRAGVERAAACGAEYVLKVRADQRAYAAGLDEALLGLLEAFPCQGKGSPRRRILVPSTDTRLFIPYHLADQLQFGHVEDVLAYWSAPLDDQPRQTDWSLSVGELAATRAVAEVYLTAHYLERQGVPAPCRLESWWDALARYFCVVDNSLLDWYWPKHDQRSEYRYRTYAEARNSDVLTFADWLRLLGGCRPALSDPNTILGLRIGDTLPPACLENVGAEPVVPPPAPQAVVLTPGIRAC
jgi:hypothetical protein